MCCSVSSAGVCNCSLDEWRLSCSRRRPIEMLAHCRGAPCPFVEACSASSCSDASLRGCRRSSLPAESVPLCCSSWCVSASVTATGIFGTNTFGVPESFLSGDSWRVGEKDCAWGVLGADTSPGSCAYRREAGPLNGVRLLLVAFWSELVLKERQPVSVMHDEICCTSHT